MTQLQRHTACLFGYPTTVQKKKELKRKRGAEREWIKKRPQMQQGAKKSQPCLSSRSIRITYTHAADIYSMASYRLISPLCASDVATSQKMTNQHTNLDMGIQYWSGISVLRTQIEGHKVLNGTRKSEHRPQGLTFRVSCVWLVIYIAGFAIQRLIFSA